MLLKLCNLSVIISQAQERCLNRKAGKKLLLNQINSYILLSVMISIRLIKKGSAELFKRGAAQGFITGKSAELL